MDAAGFKGTAAVRAPGRGRRSERTQASTKYSQQVPSVSNLLNLISQTGCPDPKHVASTLSQSKTKVIHSVTLEDPLSRQFLPLGSKMRHFWKDNLLSPGKRYFKTEHLIATFKEKPTARSPSRQDGDHIRGVQLPLNQEGQAHRPSPQVQYPLLDASPKAGLPEATSVSKHVSMS